MVVDFRRFGDFQWVRAVLLVILGPVAAGLLIFGEFGPFWADLLIFGEIGPFW